MVSLCWDYKEVYFIFYSIYVFLYFIFKSLIHIEFTPCKVCKVCCQLYLFQNGYSVVTPHIFRNWSIPDCFGMPAFVNFPNVFSLFLNFCTFSCLSIHCLYAILFTWFNSVLFNVEIMTPTRLWFAFVFYIFASNFILNLSGGFCVSVSCT